MPLCLHLIFFDFLRFPSEIPLCPHFVLDQTSGFGDTKVLKEVCCFEGQVLQISSWGNGGISFLKVIGGFMCVISRKAVASLLQSESSVM